MELATQILVVIVSVVLTIFLIGGIVVVVLVARLINQIRRLAATAEQLAGDAAQISTVLKNASGPLALFKIISNIITSIHKS